MEISLSQQWCYLCSLHFGGNCLFLCLVIVLEEQKQADNITNSRQPAGLSLKEGTGCASPNLYTQHSGTKHLDRLLPIFRKYPKSPLLFSDKCKPDLACARRTRAQEAYVDAVFILDSSQKMNPREFVKVRGFLSDALDHFVVSSEPATSSVGDRIALVNHAPPAFQPHLQKTPVKTEFNLVTYHETEAMKRHVQESVQQLGGVLAVGHAIQWTMNNIFSEAPNPRKQKVITVISAGETSPWDKELLKKASLRAKCQGYVLLVLSLGPTYSHTELEDLASLPLEQHLIQLGRIHEPELKYAQMFLKAFLHLLRSKFWKHGFQKLFFLKATESPSFYLMSRNITMTPLIFHTGTWKRGEGLFLDYNGQNLPVTVDSRTAG